MKALASSSCQRGSPDRPTYPTPKHSCFHAKLQKKEKNRLLLLTTNTNIVPNSIAPAKIFCGFFDPLRNQTGIDCVV